MKIIEAQEVRELLTMPKCIELMREALANLDSGKVFQPLRTFHSLPGGNAFGFMPAYLGDADYFGAKIITIFPNNLGTQYPTHMGYVMMFESRHGSCVGMADCSAITEIRTGAVSGVATDLLARKDSHSLGIIGAGAQGRSHLEAILCVRDITAVRVFDIIENQARRFADQMSEKLNIPVTAVSSVEAAVCNSDIVCTVTPSKDPFLGPEFIRSGTHINAVGAYTPTTREITSELVARSKFYVDNVEAIKRECGEYLIPLQEGLITEDHIVGSIGNVILGKIAGRQNDTDITIFDALGLAVEDIVCGRYLCC